jgi:redox-sensitive bicupin YhaK (pirin superfamily)
MQKLRPSDARGHANLGWLDSRHSFSFGQYFDPKHMGFGPLRVINEDRVNPGTGFDTHGHKDMEIISYVLDGALEHKDSLGSGSVIHPGEVQLMTAGSGIRHSEYNPSKTDPVHFLQIWITPETEGLAPGYQQKHFAPEESEGRLRLVASRDGRNASLTIHRDVDFYMARLDGDQSLRHQLAPGRIAWLQVARGALRINGEALAAGDGVAIEDETSLVMNHGEGAEILLFDMAA